MAAGDTRAGHRYARALFHVAQKLQAVDAIGVDLAQVHKTSLQSPQLMQVLGHPRFTRERKRALIEQIFSGLRPEVSTFLNLLIEHNRIGALPTIVTDYARLVDELNREADAEAVSAVPLSEAQQEALRAKLQATTGLKVRLKTRVDPGILGGMTVRVGDRLIDGSIVTQLQTMRDNLKRVRVGE